MDNVDSSPNYTNLGDPPVSINGYYKRQNGCIWIVMLIFFGLLFGVNLGLYIAWQNSGNLVVMLMSIMFLFFSFGYKWLEIEDCGSYLKITINKYINI